MSVRIYRVCCAILIFSLALFALIACYDAANAQSPPTATEPATTPPAATQPAVTPPAATEPTATPPTATAPLPQIVVSGAKPKPKPRAVTHQATAPATVAPLTPAQQTEAKNNAFDQARGNLYSTIGTTTNTISHDTIEALPQGSNATVEKVLLQAPGVSQDSAASGLLHVRNDHANVQFRINGVMLPDGVTGFGSIFDTSFIGSMSLVTGALPAEFGGRTVGIVDMTTRADAFNNSGDISYYGGSRGTIEPSFDYGGTFGGTCPTKNVNRRQGAAVIICRMVVGLHAAGAIFLQRSLFANHGGHRESAADAQRHSRFLTAGKRASATCRPSSISGRA